MAQKAQNQPTLLRLCYTAPDKLGDEMKEEIRQELARQIAAKFSQARGEVIELTEAERQRRDESALRKLR